MNHLVKHISVVLIGFVMLGCEFTFHHDTHVDPSKLPEPFVVVEGAENVVARKSLSGFCSLDFTLHGNPDDLLQEVALANSGSPDWIPVKKPGLGEWWGGDYEGTLEYHACYAWKRPGPRAFAVQATVFSDPGLTQTVRFHLAMYPPSDAGRYLDGLDGIQEEVEFTKRQREG